MMYDTIIIGSGPAGYTAALYTSRAYLKTLLLSGLEVGGQLTTTTHVENFPGFPDGILGPKLVEDMKKQVERFGTNVVNDVITNVQILPISNTTNPPAGRTGKPINNEKFFTLKGQNATYQARSVIIATGASAQYLGLPSEQVFAGKGVSACATCDGFFFRGKEVVVVGGGDTAMEEATFLSKFATKVTIIHRREEFRASAIMLDRAKKDPKISFITNKIVEEIVGDTSVTGVRIKDAITGEVSTFATQGVFLAIGHKPSTQFLKDFIELDQKGYIIIRSSKLKAQSSNQDESKHNLMLDPQTETSVQGVFAAGDCVDPHYRQAVVAAGQGCMAAMDAEKYLEEQDRKIAR